MVVWSLFSALYFYSNLLSEVVSPIVAHKEALSAAVGLDYWRKTIPGDIQERVKTRIETLLNNVPGSERSHFNDLRVRLDQCDVGDYPKIIAMNWTHFATYFRSKDDCARMMNDFRVYRNAIKHNQPVDALLDLRGQTSILWISRAIELDLSTFGID